ncbi:hypothetical protein [Staphylococcus phage vB_StaM_PB50]|nr:hypothetical protein [Staphylococcus phage vB_StaM_PB50]
MMEEGKVPFSFEYKRNERKFFLHRRGLKNFIDGESELLLYSDKDGNGFILEKSKLDNLLEQELIIPSYEEDII